MTWAYDNELAAPIRTLIRNDIVARLQPLVKPIGFLEAVIGIGFGIDGKHDDHGIDMLEKELLGRVPAIAVSTCGSKFQPAGAPDRSIAMLDVDLYFMSTHLRGLTDGRVAGDPAAAASDNADPGIDAMMQLAWQLLFDSSFALPGTTPSTRRAQPLKLLEEQELITTEGATVWHQRWSTQVTYDVNLYRGITQKLVSAFTTLRAHSDLEPESTMTEQTTVDATADTLSLKLCPATAAEFATVLARVGITTGGPRSIFPMQDASTPLVDALGVSTVAEVVPGAGHYSYRNVLAGWSGLAIGTTTGAVDIGFVQQHGNLPDPATKSYLMLCYVQLASMPSTNQGLMSCTDSAIYLGVQANTRLPIVGSASGLLSSGQHAIPVGQVIPVVLKVDNGRRVVKAYTPFEILNESYSTPAANSGEVDFGVALASGIFSANAFYRYAALFTGAAAEMSDDQIGALLTAMGWTIDWYAAPAKDALSSVYCPEVPHQWSSLDVSPPGFAWPLQEGSGNTYVDVAGDCPLVAQPGITAGQSVGGMTRVGLRLPDGGLNVYAASTDSRLPDPRTSSVAILVYANITSAAFGSVGTLYSWLQGFTTDQLCFALVKPTGQLGIYQNNVMTFGTVNHFGSPRPLLLTYDRAAGRVALFTDAERIVASNFATPGTHGGISLGIGGGIVPCPGAAIAGMWAWSGPAAEMSDAKAKALLQTLGWTVAW